MSSVKMDWATPQAFVDNVCGKYGADLDACATEANKKADLFISPEQNSLTTSWCNVLDADFGTVWVNPPYGRELPKWVDKCMKEAHEGLSIYLLVPARPDTKWFHKLYVERANLFYFIKGRITFEGAPSPAPFPSCLIHLNGYSSTMEDRVRYMDKHGVRL
jgi:site-specific DNA-methyltransferase (adenine-specific)